MDLGERGEGVWKKKEEEKEDEKEEEDKRRTPGRRNGREFVVLVLPYGK